MTQKILIFQAFESLQENRYVQPAEINLTKFNGMHSFRSWFSTDLTWTMKFCRDIVYSLDKVFRQILKILKTFLLLLSSAYQPGSREDENMKKNKIWNILAVTAGSFAVLVSSQMVMRPFASMKIPENGYEVEGPEQCRRLLMEVVSGTKIGERRECLITGIDYEPESLVIAQMFPDTVNISNTKIMEYQENGHRYVTCRIGFERSPEREEESKGVEGGVVGRHWKIGDLRNWEIGGKTYLFRCIDDNYRSSSEDQSFALFLCETVIRSDVDSTDSQREILTFGGTNNYKTSEIRRWLQENVNDPEDYLVSVDTGVNAAYLGTTVPGTFEEFSTSGLLRHELYYQMAEDEVFLLSLEEAIQYRDVLWKLEGGGTPYSHGYWLRTPSFSMGENGAFCYGNWAYAVDLEKGCIRPAEVNDGSIGIRPAFCLPQA